MSIEPFSKERVIELASPYLKGVFHKTSSEGRSMYRARRRGTLISALRLGLQQVVHLKRERLENSTKQIYSSSYAQDVKSIGTYDAELAPTARANPFILGQDTLLLLPPIGLFSVYLATLAEVIGSLKPSTVCEVGFGSGKNLMYLAPRFPDIRFCGYELSHSGVALAKQLQEGNRLPPNLGRLVGQNDESAMAAIRRIAFHQGNAKNLPAADKSVDLTFTVLALEQMWPILPQVLAEVRRITRSHVVFLEAFREVNDWLGYLNLLSRNYFRADLSRVEAAGLKPVTLLRHLPNKLTFSAAVLVAEVMPEKPLHIRG